MANYLSDEWFEQLGATTVPADAALTGEDLILQHVVTGAPQGEVTYHVRISGGAVAIVRGPASQPDVTFAEDYATAAAVASGELRAPAALLAGRIRVGGNMATLIARHDDLAITDPVPAAVRAATTY
ncbi:MAG: SCP2 sterol-binding domain-containing protein [Actinomycetota bacterium]|nr:SCP2 sterol-binding domain-containing protein [Actinomycetota bacterium]